MNWTGRRLRRLSAHDGVLTKAQKQNFAKSRQQASNRALRQPSIFRGSPDPDRYDHNELNGGMACNNGQMMGHEAQNFTTSSTPPPLAGSLSADRPGHLETLKRRLLQDHDWAAVSVVRPLEITFASADEAEHFGKRRRLTETDRKRLSVTNRNQTTLAFPKPRFGGNGCVPLDQIQIKITDQSSGQILRESQDDHILPDGNGAHNDHSKISGSVPPRLSINARHSGRLRSDPRTSRAPSSPMSFSFHGNLSLVEDRRVRGGTECGPPPTSPLQPRFEPSCSPTETLPASPTLMATDSLSTNETQSWLPQTARRVSRSSSLLVHSETARAAASTSNALYHSQNSSDQLTRCTGETCPQAPIKIFGQLVSRRCTHGADVP